MLGNVDVIEKIFMYYYNLQCTEGLNLTTILPNHTKFAPRLHEGREEKVVPTLWTGTGLSYKAHGAHTGTRLRRNHSRESPFLSPWTRRSGHEAPFLSPRSGHEGHSRGSSHALGHFPGETCGSPWGHLLSWKPRRPSRGHSPFETRGATCEKGIKTEHHAANPHRCRRKLTPT